MEKVILFTHNDGDAFACAAIVKLAFDEPVIEFANNKNLDELIEHHFDELDGFDKIYIADHCPSQQTCNKLQESFGGKVEVFDHHKSRVGQYDAFPWVHIAPDLRGRPTCGAELLYEHLATQGKIAKTNALNEFIELIRVYDADWADKKRPQAEHLNYLFLSSENIADCVDGLVDKLSKERKHFELNSAEENQIKDYLAWYNGELDKYSHSIRKIDFNGTAAGYGEILPAFKNDIIAAVQKLPIGKEIQFLLLKVEGSPTYSLRTLGDFNVGALATQYGGGGHPFAASIPVENIPQEVANQIQADIENQ